MGSVRPGTISVGSADLAISGSMPEDQPFGVGVIFDHDRGVDVTGESWLGPG